MSDIGNKEVFAINLAYYLKRSGKGQREVADAIGVASSTFNEWMKGKKYPRIDKIELLASYFRIKKSDLIESRAKPTPNDPQMTEGEALLLGLFRQVPEDQQQLVLQMIRAALNVKE